MATAKNAMESRQIQCTVTDTELFKVVDLRLTPEEAQTLAEVCGWIGGCTEKSRRRHTDSIRRALFTAGVSIIPIRGDISGNLAFK